MKKGAELLQDYHDYLQLERNLAQNSIVSYQHDLDHLMEYCELYRIDFLKITYPQLESFLAYLADLGLGQRSMQRIVSGIKGFYHFLELEGILEANPTDLIEMKRVTEKLPEVLTLEEIDAILNEIDTCTDHGLRNRAMLELLYSCGLRVSELCNLTFSALFLEDAFIRVIGKGSKERLIPMSPEAIYRIEEYLPLRHAIMAKPGHSDYLFLSRLGKRVSRQTIFKEVKQLALAAGIQKEISPHTFRHSFATHLLEGGAHLQAIREMMGHADISTTEIYTHIDRTHLREEILTHHPRNL